LSIVTPFVDIINKYFIYKYFVFFKFIQIFRVIELTTDGKDRNKKRKEEV